MRSQHTSAIGTDNSASAEKLMRIGVIALLQESNTFLPERTTLEKFQQDVLLVGEPIRDYFAAAHHEIGGFFSELSSANIEAVPIFAARALPYGIIQSETWAQLMGMMMDALQRAGPLDGVLVAPHGATVSESEPDADGYWLSQVRLNIGPLIPIIGTLDLHANLSERMVAACDALIAYRTNPHTDQFACGCQAARLMIRTLRGEIRPTQAAAFPPMVVNIQQQETAVEPCRAIYEMADRQLSKPGVLSNSVVLGFPYADVAEMGTATLVVTNDDGDLAHRLADELAMQLWSNRTDFVGQFISIDEAIQKAAGLPSPVCLLDMGDNVGGGSPADSTWLAKALNHCRNLRSLICLYDPAAVAQCKTVSIGSSLQLAVGGHSGKTHGNPLPGEFKLLGLYEGKFEEHEARHGGFTTFDQGPSAVVQTQHGLTIVLTSKRMAPFSLGQITSCGLNPQQFDIVVAKGVVAPMAAYRSVCGHFIRVNTPGVTTADLSRLDYQQRRKPLFPFEAQTEWPSPDGTEISHR